MIKFLNLWKIYKEYKINYLKLNVIYNIKEKSYSLYKVNLF